VDTIHPVHPKEYYYASSVASHVRLFRQEDENTTFHPFMHSLLMLETCLASDR
jgi:hypothetical protein